MIEYLDLKALNARFGKEIDDAIKRVVGSGWYLRGEENRRFESDYAEYIGTKQCVGCGNGLDALTLILRAYIELGVMAEGDEVIVPANTYIASILAITESGLVPKLIEPKLETFQIDDSLIEKAISTRTKAIMIVHLYGKCAYTKRIKTLCDRYGLKLIEDNAQAHGCLFEDRHTGSLGDVAAHSFYPGKNLGALGDAGAVTTNDEELARTVRAIANYGSSSKYVFRYKGRNSRMDEIQAAVLTIKLKHLDADNHRRREIANRYVREVNNPLLRLPNEEFCQNSVHHIFPVLCETRDKLQQYLTGNGVQTIIHYPIPPHKQECYKEWAGLQLPITEKIHNEELSIPLNPILTDAECTQIAKLLNEYVQ